jgi:KAP family P-loop domain
LADRIVRIRNEENEKQASQQREAFLLHIHGPWGSGKSSLLNFIHQELEQKSPKWIVIKFDAWQHQRAGPPWWFLMDVVFRQSVGILRTITWWRSIKLMILEHSWRLWTARSNIFVWPMIIFGVIGLGILLGYLKPGSFLHVPESGKELVNFLSSGVGAVAALIVSALSGIRALSSSLLPGSERAAREFVELSTDPMNRIRNHFKDLIKWIKQPVAIFIDDLDRCKESYTVEFLEGIQTLFREANVTFVIAADRRWIYASYEKAYDVFSPALREPGSPFGQLFLDKIFQLSVSLPRMSKEVQQQYWENLLQTNTASNIQKNEPEKLKQARKELELAGTEDEVMQVLRKGTGSPLYDQILRQTAVVRLSSPEVEVHTEHMLNPFAMLLDPNPRSMKRLVNAYGIARAIDLLRGGNVERKKLALWTIFTFRWPDLAHYLEEKPAMVENIRQKKITDDVPEELRKLFWDCAVLKVINGLGEDGKNVGVSLDADIISELAGLRTSNSSAAVVG